MPGAMRFAGTQRHLQGLTRRPSCGCINTVCSRHDRIRGTATRPSPPCVPRRWGPGKPAL